MKNQFTSGSIVGRFVDFISLRLQKFVAEKDAQYQLLFLDIVSPLAEF